MIGVGGLRAPRCAARLVPNLPAHPFMKLFALGFAAAVARVVPFRRNPGTRPLRSVVWSLVLGAVLALTFSVDAASDKPTPGPDAPASVRPSTGPTRQWWGTNLEGWTVVVGDGVQAMPGEAPVGREDIETLQNEGFSEIRANVRRRRVMAHNITFRRITDDAALRSIQTFGFKFRLPYLPVPDARKEEAGQTVEAGVFTWDGNGSRLDHGVAFQWLVNPWLPNFGEIRCWNAKDGGSWLPAGLTLKPDTEWHEVRLTVDMRRKTTAISIDGRVVSSAFTALPKPAAWGRTTDARAQIEAISVFPGEKGALHRVEVRDWFWDWEME